MKSIRKTITFNLNTFAQNTDEIINLLMSHTGQSATHKYTVKFTGRLYFIKTGGAYGFESAEDFKQILALENPEDVFTWDITIRIEDRARNSSIGVNFDRSVLADYSNISISELPYKTALIIMDEIVEQLNAQYFVDDPEGEELSKRQEIEERANAVLERMPDLQLRIRSELSSEKQVQDFLFPILKSHFEDLQEEDYLAKVAGSASKPDFGIESAGVAFEVKYNSEKTSFKKLADEIAIDSRKYFGSSSPFKSMIVIIYNGSSESPPANYVPDLENIDVVSRVIISPKILPRLNKTVKRAQTP